MLFVILILLALPHLDFNPFTAVFVYIHRPIKYSDMPVSAIGPWYFIMQRMMLLSRKLFFVW